MPALTAGSLPGCAVCRERDKRRAVTARRGCLDRGCARCRSGRFEGVSGSRQPNASRHHGSWLKSNFGLSPANPRPSPPESVRKMRRSLPREGKAPAEIFWIRCGCAARQRPRSLDFFHSSPLLTGDFYLRRRLVLADSGQLHDEKLTTDPG